MNARRPPTAERKLHTKLNAELSTIGYAHTSVRRMFQPDRKMWMTGTSSPGWPDIVAVRGPYLLAIEVKNDRTYPTEEQTEWLIRFTALPYARCWVLRPRDPWPRVLAWLRDPGEAPRVHGWQQRSALPFDDIPNERTVHE